MNKTLNNLHFLYSFLVALFLIGTALLTSIRTQNPLLPLFFLPLLIYFLVAFYKRLYFWAYSASHDPDPQHFHFLLFATQDHPLFLITLGLFVLTFTLSIIKGLLLP